ncbi:LysR family transcriptional regulator [Anoxynatronum sibiricum]|uniref:LysR family transcriptional regulator n=1 Tax=Anoxynatronum sibiricum TaxID=210623 RepID=A0ABU9VW44_9CLOT
MNHNTLRYIIAVADERSFTKAAQKLFIAQPSLSQIIKSEEKKLGITLFDRSCSPIMLTDAGQEYVLWARQVLSIQKNMERRLQDFSQNGISIIRMGILPECSAFILPEPLKAFREKNPNRCVQIRELSSSDLKKSLENAELDFIVGLTHPDTFKYCNEPLYDEQIVLATTHDFLPVDTDVDEVDLASFSEAPFVMMEEGQFLYHVTHDLCKRCGFVPRTVVECYNLETALHMVKAGVGIAVIPDLMALLVEGLHYYKISGPTPASQISVVYPRDRYLPREARELIDLIKWNAE